MLTGGNESMAQRHNSLVGFLAQISLVEPSALCGGVIFNHTLRTFKYTFNFLRRTMFGCILSIPKDCQLARKGLLDYGNLRLEIANASNSSKSFYCHGSLLLPFATASKTSMQRVLIPCESVMFSRSATERR